MNRYATMYRIKEKIVKEGRSQVLKEWKKISSWQGYTLTTEEFLENLKWLCEDPMTDGRWRREIGLTPKGIVKLDRLYIKEEVCVFRMHKPNMGVLHSTWSGACFKVPCNNPDFADKNGFWKTNFKFCLSPDAKI